MGALETETKQRRADDARISQLLIDHADLKRQHGKLHACVDSLQAEVKRNTEVTEQVRDILTSFRVLAAVAKWVSKIGAAFAAIYYGAEHALDFLQKIRR